MAIITLEDLMLATYKGNYALTYMSGMPMLPKGGGPGAYGSQRGGYMMPQDEIAKADDPFLTSKTTYFNPIYGQTAMDWLNHEANLWKLFKKDTYQARGDAIRLITAPPSNFYGANETASAFGDTDIPELTELEYTDPAVMYNIWDSSLLAQLKTGWQDSPRRNAALFFKEYMALEHPRNINEWLGKDTDIPAQGGGANDNYIESIDRVCSDSNESPLLSLPTDNDIYGFDRSAGEAEAYVDLNAGTLRDFDLGQLDDALASIKQFSERKEFILITTEGTVNKIEAAEAVKQRWHGQEKWKVDTLQGVNTRKGAEIGFSVSAVSAAGVNIPIFTSQDIHAEIGGSGNIYILDVNHIFIRNALPTVYFETRNPDFLTVGSFLYKYMYMTVAQLISDKFSCHAAIKYLN